MGLPPTLLPSCTWVPWTRPARAVGLGSAHVRAQPVPLQALGLTLLLRGPSGHCHHVWPCHSPGSWVSPQIQPTMRPRASWPPCQTVLRFTLTQHLRTGCVVSVDIGRANGPPQLEHCSSRLSPTLMLERTQGLPPPLSPGVVACFTVCKVGLMEVTCLEGFWEKPVGEDTSVACTQRPLPALAGIHSHSCDWHPEFWSSAGHTVSPLFITTIPWWRHRD